ncbi:unnamed protein product [[Candida] boidinii]|uniref:Unnamed protein product n=1 Tax=Candida boidinii TaxID=5477 RepID=A0ACB5TKN9_CANBO|nr:unnamed protein product [[Candida] boidinii]
MTLNLEHSFGGHKDKCWSVSVHEKLPLLASVSSDKTCRVYNIKTHKLLAVLDENTHSKAIRSVAWRPNCEIPSLAMGSFDSTVSIWSKDEFGEMDDEPNNLTNFSSSNNESLVSQAAENWLLMAIIEGHENEIKSVDWSSNGLYLATCSRDKSTWIWETDENNEEFECINVIQEHTQDVKHVVWHPREILLASSSYDDTTKLFRQDPMDEDDWLCVSNLTEQDGTVWCADFEKKIYSDNNNNNNNTDETSYNEIIRLVNCSDDGKLRIWKRVNSAGLKKRGDDDLPTTIRSESPNEEWNLESVLPVEHTMPVYSCSWGKNGKIASVGADGNLVIYKEVQVDGKSKWEIDVIKPLAHGVFEMNCVKWWDTSDNEDDNLLLTAGDDGNVNLWSLK